MKKLLVVLGLLVILATPALAANFEDPTIARVTLRGGNLTAAGEWTFNSQVWDTGYDHWWVLGVSGEADGDLLNESDGTIANLALGTYWLYASKTDLGSHVKLVVVLYDKTSWETVFVKSGAEGVENTWEWFSGSDLLSLGWAQGCADKMGGSSFYSFNNSSGSNPHPMLLEEKNDFYLKADIGLLPSGHSVPLPGALLLFGSGLLSLGVVGFRRRSRS